MLKNTLLYKDGIPCPSLQELRCDSREALRSVGRFVKSREKVGIGFIWFIDLTWGGSRRFMRYGWGLDVGYGSGYTQFKRDCKV